MSEAKRMEDAEFEDVRTLAITVAGGPKLAPAIAARINAARHLLGDEAERARASEAALEARLAAGVEAARMALEALAHESICAVCAQGTCSDCDCCERDRTEAALRSFVEGSR